MTANCPDVPPRGPGRPRDHALTRKILHATTTALGEVGFAQLRVQHIASTVGVSLATIYRRWPTKTALVVDAIRRDEAPWVGPGHDEDLASVLLELITALASPRARRLALLATLTDEPDITRAVREVHVPEVRRRVRAALHARVGTEPAEIELLVDIAPALIWYRTLVLGESVRPEELAGQIGELVDRMRR